MKKLLIILAFLPLLARAQPAHPWIKIVTQEYAIIGLDANHEIWAWGSIIQNSASYPLPGGRTVVALDAGFNAARVIANDGTVWISAYYNTGLMSSWTQITTDTTGTTINDATDVLGFENTYFIKRAGGAWWEGGNDFFNILETSGATIRPTKITPSGANVATLVAEGSAGSTTSLMGITSDSLTVYQWTAGSGTSPTPITTTIGTHKFLAVGTDGGAYAYANFYLVQMTQGSHYGHPVATGINCILMGGSSSCSFNYTMHDLYSDLSLTSLVKEIQVNPFLCLTIDSAGNMFNYGGWNVQGQLGVGDEFVNKYSYANATCNFGWDFNIPEYPVYGKHQIGTGHQWKHIYNQGFYVFYNYALDVNDSLYAWGRGKQNILAQGWNMVDNDYDNHPNCMDLLVPTPAHYLTTNVHTDAFTLPSLSLGASQTIHTSSVTLTQTGHPALLINTANSADTDNYTPLTNAITQISGPNTATIVSPNSPSTSITGMINGTYIFRDTTIDNAGGTNRAQDTITVSLTTPPTVSPGSNQTITLPTSSASLAGTVTYNGGATGSTVSWTVYSQPSGSAAPTITPGGTLTAPTASVSGMVQGVYIYKLSATDSNGNTSFSTVTITVNAAVGSGCSPCLPSPVPISIHA